jgi:hypothetical protein
MSRPEVAVFEERTPARVVSGATPETLAAIYDDDVNAAVWERPAVQLVAPGGTTRHLDAIDIEASVPASALDDWLRREIPDELSALRDDLAEVAAMYACLFAVDYLGIRLRTLDRAMCPRFHVDRVVCRLLTTYEGPGTEYLADVDVDRSQLGRPVTDLRQLPVRGGDAPVHQLSAGAVLLCKGESWPGNEGRGFVHRSPEPGAGPRLMLCIDGLSRER